MAKTTVRIAHPGGIVWDPDQSDPQNRVITEGKSVPVELTAMIGKKIREGILVEADDADESKGAPTGHTKLDPKDWPDRETLKAMKLSDLKSWAKVQELQFAGNLGEEKLLDLIDEHRPKVGNQ